jgi:hypothetical protein
MSTFEVEGSEAPLNEKPNAVPRALIFGATFFSVGAVSTAVQLGTAIGLGTFDNYRWGWSTGGLLALVALISMHVRTPRAWRVWWSRMWPWLAITAVLAFAVMIAAFKPATSTVGLKFGPSFGLVSQWAKVDEPSRLAEVESGSFNIAVSEINPCHVGQPWGDCINAHIDEYSQTCVGTSLTATAASLCRNYEQHVVQMQNEGGPGFTVASLGGYGTLHLVPETTLTRIPAVTHVAVCYLGVFGECS